MTNESVKDLVWELEAEVNNGGFHQFFFNSAGDRTADTIRALKVIGAVRTAEIVGEAAAMFPGGMPSADRYKRQNQLEQVSPNGDEFDSLDERFYRYEEDLESLVEAYGG